MPTFDPQVRSCRLCQHYQAHGRRGGQCHKLNVTVQGGWDACPLATPMFEVALDLSACLALVPNWVGQEAAVQQTLDPVLEAASSENQGS